MILICNGYTKDKGLHKITYFQCPINSILYLFQFDENKSFLAIKCLDFDGVYIQFRKL